MAGIEHPSSFHYVVVGREIFDLRQNNSPQKEIVIPSKACPQLDWGWESSIFFELKDTLWKLEKIYLCL
ncbi:MAG: hypothetical protein B1H05_00680 [Candidatus Cloacimonas sp. 4484_140]|nr:MAG: hypothetical protein B1H05_00680 [Candidatus Cloacimonas sp. 4484_140]